MKILIYVVKRGSFSERLSKICCELCENGGHLVTVKQKGSQFGHTSPSTPISVSALLRFALD